MSDNSHEQRRDEVEEEVEEWAEKRSCSLEERGRGELETSLEDTLARWVPGGGGLL